MEFVFALGWFVREYLLPAGIVVSTTVAVVAGVVATVVALAACGPGVVVAARLTASSSPALRPLGWTGLVATVVVALGSAVVAIGCAAVILAGLTLSAPGA